MPAQLTASRSGASGVTSANAAATSAGLVTSPLARTMPSVAGGPDRSHPAARSKPITRTPASARAAAVAAPNPDAAPVTMAEVPAICIEDSRSAGWSALRSARYPAGSAAAHRRAVGEGSGSAHRGTDGGMRAACPVRIDVRTAGGEAGGSGLLVGTVSGRSMAEVRRCSCSASPSSPSRTARWCGRALSKTPLTRSVVDRFIAGETTADAVAAVADLHAHGLQVSLDHLGEDTKDRAAADAHRRRLPGPAAGDGGGGPGVRARNCR